jgi:hypothetical protein
MRCDGSTGSTTECETNHPCGDGAHDITWSYRDLIGTFARLDYRGKPEVYAGGWENESMRFGRMLIIIGLFVLALGLIVSIGERLPIRLGRLPGDIVLRGKNSVFYFPIVTSLLISVILSVVLWLFGRR